MSDQLLAVVAAYCGLVVAQLLLVVQALAAAVALVVSVRLHTTWRA